jgi:hypothetical protein
MLNKNTTNQPITNNPTTHPQPWKIKKIRNKFKPNRFNKK